ncbi:MAG: 2-polyprenyl-3-methyl-6-methoxy-1,4-benzoquinone monooxygenase [Sinimarinibacterium flocculans]|uniref:2-polyprenyl-3-methyl-6-methoxy-1,4-benzoquinone monooxygenase n=1 Tax=Sinimarinibacterium flocculans TaxID=985250 RepID=UPI003C660783
MQRQLSAVDRLLAAAGRGLSRLPERTPPAAPSAADATLAPPDRTHAAGLMRINHAGEIAAQALYRGQALVARNPQVRRHLLKAAEEERDHLQWCEQRLRELGDGPSRLAPLWYAGSYAIGATAGLAGDHWSLGFVEETERQVAAHLDEHLARLPEEDRRSRDILSRMRSDEERHGREAHEAGARPLPRPVRRLMQAVAGVMKFGAYRI